MAEGNLQQLLRRPFPEGLLRQVLVGIVGVVVEPAAHLRELPERDPVAARHALDVAVDRIVETKLALVRQHQDGSDHERLGVAADAHGEVRGHRLAARRVADAERAHVGRLPLAPHADNGPRDGGSLHARADGLGECGVTFLRGDRLQRCPRARGRGARLATPRQQRSRRGAAQHDDTPPRGQTLMLGRSEPVRRHSLVAGIASHVRPSLGSFARTTAKCHFSY